MEILEYQDAELSLPEATRIVELTNSIWPQTEKPESDIVQELLQKAKAPETPVTSKRTRFVIWENERVVAHAQVFVRRIFTGSGDKDVLALAGVCTDLASRGQGMGVAVVQRAFERLAELELSACLFQTGVVPFYEKLGARTIDNRFVNRANTEDPSANPWWDKAVMIYPANTDWPEGEIDLGGVGY